MENNNYYKNSGRYINQNDHENARLYNDYYTKNLPLNINSNIHINEFDKDNKIDLAKNRYYENKNNFISIKNSNNLKNYEMVDHPRTYINNNNEFIFLTESETNSDKKEVNYKRQNSNETVDLNFLVNNINRAKKPPTIMDLENAIYVHRKFNNLQALYLENIRQMSKNPKNVELLNF